MSFARLAHRAWLPTLVVAAFSGPALAVEFADVYEQLLHGDKAQGMWGLASLAQSGDTRAQYVLGVAFIEGKTIERDLVRGYAWSRSRPTATSYARTRQPKCSRAMQGSSSDIT